MYRDNYNAHCFIKVNIPGVRDMDAEYKQNKRRCTTLRYIGQHKKRKVRQKNRSTVKKCKDIYNHPVLVRIIP